MNGRFDADSSLAAESVNVPLFPLPNVVGFPHTLLPLHIFEERYRHMTADALADQRSIAIALLRPGWQKTYESKTAAIHDVVCVGRIVSDVKLDDGTYNLIFHGHYRAAVESELEDQRLYRTGVLRPIADYYPTEPDIDRDHRRWELLASIQQLYSEMNLDYGFNQAGIKKMELGPCCDVLASAVPISRTVGQQLLEEANVDLRSDQLLTAIRQLVRNKKQQHQGQEYPPNFSDN